MNNRFNAPSDEDLRIAAVERFKALDASVHKSFVSAANILQKMTRTPIAGFSLLGQETQWFTSAMGGDLIESRREETFCQYANKSDIPLIIPNARTDPDYADHPLVGGDPYIQFYMGLCVRDADQYPLGALCAADMFPRSIDDNAYFVAVNLRDMLQNILVVAAQRRVS
jgi:GAF domain-containing protein